MTHQGTVPSLFLPTNLQIFPFDKYLLSKNMMDMKYVNVYV